MNPRVPHQTNSKGEVFALGLRFPSLEAAEKAVDAIIAKREAIARRPLTAKEIRDGVSPPDTRTERERIADAQWQPKLPRTAKPDDNPFRDDTDYAERFDGGDGKETREQFRQRSAREWDEKKARERAAKAKERIEQAQAEYHASQQRIAMLRPPQEPQQEPPAYKPTNEFIRAGDKIVEWDGDKIVNRHDANTCDPEIATLAQ